jgi:hypothetical protein
VCFKGKTRGTNAAGYVELGPEQLGTAPRGFWTRLEDDLIRSARIDRQKYISKGDDWYCVYHLQFEDFSVACVIVRVDFDVNPHNMRHAFHISLEELKKVWVVPAGSISGSIRHER